MKLQRGDWDALFSIEQFKIGNTVLDLKPLPLNALPLLAKHFKKITKSLSDSKITSENYKDKIEELMFIILGGAPGLLSVMSGLDITDIPKLPIGVATSLLMACIDINMKDQGDFLKNLMALANKMTEMTVTTNAILGK